MQNPIFGTKLMLQNTLKAQFMLQKNPQKTEVTT